MTPGSNTFIVAMNDAFKQEGRALLDALKAAVKSGDALQTASTAHDLGGAARRIGADRLRDACIQVEKIARLNTVAEAIPLMEGFEELFFDAMAEANKNSNDRRLEGIERSILELQILMKTSMEDTRKIMVSAAEHSQEASHRQTEAVDNLSNVIQNTFKDLIDSLTGKGQVSTDVMASVTKTMDDTMKRTNRLCMGIVAALIFVIVFLLTGQKEGWFHLPGNIEEKLEHMMPQH